MQIMLLMALLAIMTALSVVAGVVLLPWRKTRPFGLYALLVEPGGAAGLFVAGFLGGRLYSLVSTAHQTQWVEWAVILLMVAWLGLGLALGTASGFALATWLWWRFSPDPYRPFLVKGYHRFITMSPWYRQRWGKTSDSRTHTAEFDNE
jgi:MFS family permease